MKVLFIMTMAILTANRRKLCVLAILTGLTGSFWLTAKGMSGDIAEWLTLIPAAVFSIGLIGTVGVKWWFTYDDV